MHQNTPNLNSNIYFEPLGLLGGSKSRFDQRRVFFAPNQKVQKPKYVFIGPINRITLVPSQHFEIGTLSPPSTCYPYHVGKTKTNVFCSCRLFLRLTHLGKSS